MELSYIQLYLTIKSHLKNILPSNFFPRLIMANNACHPGKHGYVVQLRTPTGTVLMNRRDLLHYCKEHSINFMHFKHLKFRYYLKNQDFPPASKMQLKDKYRILFKYTKQILSDHKNGVFSHRCCDKQFCRKEAFNQHRNIFHSNTTPLSFWQSYYECQCSTDPKDKHTIGPFDKISSHYVYGESAGKQYLTQKFLKSIRSQATEQENISTKQLLTVVDKYLQEFPLCIKQKSWIHNHV